MEKKNKFFNLDETYFNKVRESREKMNIDDFDILKDKEKETIIKQLYSLLKKVLPLNFVLGSLKYVNKEKAFDFLVSLLKKTCKFHREHDLVSDLIKYATVLNFNPIVLVLLNGLSEYCRYENSNPSSERRRDKNKRNDFFKYYKSETSDSDKSSKYDFSKYYKYDTNTNLKDTFLFDMDD